MVKLYNKERQRRSRKGRKGKLFRDKISGKERP